MYLEEAREPIRGNRTGDHVGHGFAGLQQGHSCVIRQAVGLVLRQQAGPHGAASQDAEPPFFVLKADDRNWRTQFVGYQRGDPDRSYGFALGPSAWTGDPGRSPLTGLAVVTDPEAAEVALALATAYSRLGRQSDAVAHYLDVWERATDSETREKAQAGLRSLAPGLKQLSALEQLTSMSEDPDLQSLAAERLRLLAPKYEDMANGADYLRQFPRGGHVETVNQRLNQLADKLYGELILYQSVGDHVKGLERIQKILTYAPQSPAAERLRDRIVLES